MIQTLILLALATANVPSQTAGIQPCIWPKCNKPVEIVQIQNCVWPKCSVEQPILAQVQTCVWPKCSKVEEGIQL